MTISRAGLMAGYNPLPCFAAANGLCMSAFNGGVPEAAARAIKGALCELPGGYEVIINGDVYRIEATHEHS